MLHNDTGLTCPFQADLLEHEAAWQFFNEWMSDLDTLSEHKWISYRARLFAFEEFLDGWVAKASTHPSHAPMGILALSLEP